MITLFHNVLPQFLAAVAYGVLAALATQCRRWWKKRRSSGEEPTE